MKNKIHNIKHITHKGWQQKLSAFFCCSTLRATRSTSRGFVALFAVLIASILLAMALSISSIAYKEQLLSINAKSSQYSFIAADSGMECALLYDVKSVIFPAVLVYDSSERTLDSIPINCGSNTFVNDTAIPNVYVYKIPVNSTVAGVEIHGCAILSINKNYPNRDGVQGTKIESRGYNAACAGMGVGSEVTVDMDVAGNLVVSPAGAGSRVVERLLTAEYIYTVGP